MDEQGEPRNILFAKAILRWGVHVFRTFRGLRFSLFDAFLPYTLYSNISPIARQGG